MKKIISVFTAVVFALTFGTVFAAEDKSDTATKGSDKKAQVAQSTTKDQKKKKKKKSHEEKVH